MMIPPGLGIEAGLRWILWLIRRVGIGRVVAVEGLAS
jgi:hypothetical protein